MRKLSGISDDIAVPFFEIYCGKRRRVQLDVEDIKGRTPLQVTVANPSPYLVGLLLNLGANVFKFVFPFRSDYDEGINNQFYEIWGYSELQIMSGALGIIERLES
ncbi:hypothetical protein TKK_0009383 [Trichogramma kaykai]